MLNVPCVYKITCIINGKIYVGSTNQFHHRVLEHQQCLRRKCHANRLLQKDWGDFSSKDFIFEVLETLSEQEYLDKSYRLQRENYWIQHYDSIHKGYNISDAFGSKPMSEEQKKMVSKRHRGMRMPQSHKDLCSKLFSGAKNPKAKKVYQYTLSGEFIRAYDYLKKVTEEIPMYRYSVIGNICNLRNSSGDFVNNRLEYKNSFWSYLSPVNNRIPPLECEPRYIN